ncbi:MAG: hypothetical protein IPI35_10580 [Deltaproteobacteria bacterium]|nr:hypothetical protein [Deltaproteobacteria bacterium]
MNKHLLSVMSLMLFATIGGCKGGESDEAPTDDSEEPSAECTEDPDCAAWEICDEDQTCVGGDRNNAIEEAESILWDGAEEGYLSAEGDQDFYTFTAEGGEFIRVTTANIGGSETMDTFVSLYSPSGKLHAQEDNHPAGRVNTYDTVLFAYLPDAGAWTLVVEDLNGDSGSSFMYELIVGEYGANTRESDAFDDPSYERDPLAAGYIYAVGFVLEESGDVDWMEFDLPYDDCPVTLYGPLYTQGSDAVPLVELFLPTGERLLSKKGLGPQGEALYFEVDGGKLILGAGDAFGDGSEDHWGFVLIQVSERGYPYELEEEYNNSDADANELEVEWESTEFGERGSAYAWGVMDELGDEDWFAVEVDDGFYLSVAGTADSLGSVLDAAIEVIDEFGDVIGEGTFGDDDFPDVYDIGPLDAGTYYVRVLAEGDEIEGLDAYYRFAAVQRDYKIDDE